MGHYLVTGAAGFVGHAVAGMLLMEGHTVMGVDNLNNAYDVRMKVYRCNKLCEFSGFEFNRYDISNKHVIQEFTDQKFDAIIHLAARAGVRFSIENPWEFYNSNVTGTLNMLELCRLTGTKKFVMASTSSVYGADPPFPTSETAETDRPLQPYAASKKAAEVLCHTYHHLYGIDVSILRYFTVYGPAGRPDLALFRFVKWIIEDQPVQVTGDGNQARGFTYVADVARGTIAALKPVGFEIFNLGGNESMSLNNLIGLIEDVTGHLADVQTLPPNPADVLNNQADTTKAVSQLGWVPEYDLRAGVENTVEWYLEERAWASDIKL